MSTNILSTKMAADSERRPGAPLPEEYGFSSVTAPKRTLMKTSYAMHKAPYNVIRYDVISYDVD